MKLNFGSEQRTEILINLSFGNMQFLLIGKSSAVVCSRRPSSFSLEQQHHTRWKWPTGSKQLRSTRQTKKWFIKRLRQSQNIMAEAQSKKLGTKMSLKLKKQRRKKKVKHLKIKFKQNNKTFYIFFNNKKLFLNWFPSQPKLRCYDYVSKTPFLVDNDRFRCQRQAIFLFIPNRYETMINCLQKPFEVWFWGLDLHFTPDWME